MGYGSVFENKVGVSSLGFWSYNMCNGRTEGMVCGFVDPSGFHSVECSRKNVGLDDPFLVVLCYGSPFEAGSHLFGFDHAGSEGGPVVVVREV